MLPQFVLCTGVEPTGSVADFKVVCICPETSFVMMNEQIKHATTITNKIQKWIFSIKGLSSCFALVFSGSGRIRVVATPISINNLKDEVDEIMEQFENEANQIDRTDY